MLRSKGSYREADDAGTVDDRSEDKVVGRYGNPCTSAGLGRSFIVLNIDSLG